MRVLLQAAVLLTLPTLLGAATPETRELIESGNSFYRMGLYEEAGKQYLRASQVDQDSPEIHFNLGNVYYKKFVESKASTLPGDRNDRTSDWEQKAITAYKQAMASSSPTLRARALYNLGNTYAESQKREEAIGAYQEALRILPNDEDTKHNLELLLKGKKVPAQVDTRVVEITETGKPVTNVVSGKVNRPGAGTILTNAVGKAEAMGGGGAGKASGLSQGLGDGQGQQQAGGAAGGAGGTAATSAADAGGGGANGVAAAGGTEGNDAVYVGGGAGTQGRLPGGAGSDAALQGSAENKFSKTNAPGGEATDAASAESTGGKTVQDKAGAGGQAGAAQGQAGATSPDKTTKDKSSASASSASSDATKPKDQDKSASSSTSTGAVDPKRQEVLDKASKAEQRFIDQWSRPPDLAKPKEQDW